MNRGPIENLRNRRLHQRVLLIFVPVMGSGGRRADRQLQERIKELNQKLMSAGGGGGAAPGVKR